MKIAFDIGGVLSKYPEQFRHIITTLFMHGNYQIYIITDMHDKKYVLEQLKLNEFSHLIPEQNVLISDYQKYGEACKAILLKENKIDILIDDFPGYLTWPWPEPAPLRLQVMPDCRLPYWSNDWKTTDGEDFGRRVFVEDKT